MYLIYLKYLILYNIELILLESHIYPILIIIITIINLFLIFLYFLIILHEGKYFLNSILIFI